MLANTYLSFELVNSFLEIFMGTSICLVLVHGVLLSVSSNFGNPVMIKNITWLSVYIIACSIFLLIDENQCSVIQAQGSSALQGMSASGSMVFTIRIISLLGCIGIFLISADSFHKNRMGFIELPILILLSVFSAVILIGSNDLLTFYLAIEMQSLCFYVMASFKRNSNYSTESGLKYFVLGALSSGFLLFGCSLIYGFLGTTNFEEIARIVSFMNESESQHSLNGTSMGVLFILLAFMFKIAAAPFHVWVPDVYEGSPLCVTAYFAVIPKISILGLCIKVCYSSFSSAETVCQVLTLFCCLISLFIGCAGALTQRKIKRLISYSAIVHTGFVLLALGAGSTLSTEALFFYMIVYLCMGLAMFAILLSVRVSTRLVFLTDLAGLSKGYPVLGLCLTLILFSMAGVPPLAGFLSKMNVFLSSIDSGLYTLTITALLLSGVSAVYYVRLVKIIYFDKPSVQTWFTEVSKPISFVIMGTLSFLIGVFFFPDPLNICCAFISSSL